MGSFSPINNQTRPSRLTFLVSFGTILPLKRSTLRQKLPLCNLNP